MEMLLMALTMALLGMAVSAVLFAAATRSDRTAEAGTVPDLAAAESEFFADNAPLENPPVSVEVLLMEIEKHVRLEREAAESFTKAPTIETLHASTASPLTRED